MPHRTLPTRARWTRVAGLLLALLLALAAPTAADARGKSHRSVKKCHKHHGKAKCVRAKKKRKPAKKVARRPAPAAPAPAAPAPAPAAPAAPIPAPASAATPAPTAASVPTLLPPLTPLFEPDYARGLVDWQAIQQPAGTQRISTAPAPGAGDDPFRPSAAVMRAELRGGDLTNTGGYLAARAEVYGRAPKDKSSPAELWPDPAGAVRWYAFSLYVPEDFPTATDTTWLTLTQWKGQYGGSPPVALEIKRGNLRLGGSKGGALLLSDLGPLAKGRWTRLVVGMRLSPDPLTGWLEVWRDGLPRIPRTPLATMDALADGRPDPVYLKQGIYRSSKWTATQVLFFSPVRVYGGELDPLRIG